MGTTTYKNPWHKRTNPDYGPACYTTDAKPTPYLDYQIYQRIHGAVWDVVKDGVCVTQRAGLRGAKQAVDEYVRMSQLVLASERGRELDIECPVCGAERNQSCSIPDPTHGGLGIELGNKVHLGRRERQMQCF